MLLDSSDVIVALIGVSGVVIGFALSEFRARIQHKAQQDAMLFETLRYLSGSPSEIVTGSSIALKYQKRNQTFHNILIPALLSNSLRLSEREMSGTPLSSDEKYALYVIWCVIGSIWTTRSKNSVPEIEKHFAEFSHVEKMFLKTEVGKSCGQYAVKKQFDWLQPAVSD